MANDSIGYEAAIHELEEIIAALESGETDVDRLAEKVHRAAALIALCKARLQGAEKEVEDALRALEAQAAD
jgi:exodeoxyribonuclease VII small subunit